MKKILKRLFPAFLLLGSGLLLGLVPLKSANAEVYETEVTSQKKWGDNYGQGTVNSMVYHASLTSDGGYIAAGRRIMSNNSDNDGVVIKYDANDEIEWQLTWGGSGSDYFSDIIEIEENNSVYYMAVGIFEDSVTVGENTITSLGSSDIVLVKIDSNGEIVWQKGWGGTEYEYVKSIVLANDGGVVINGGFYSSVIDASGTGEAITLTSWEMAYVVKFDYSGTVVWQKGYEECSPYYGKIVSNPSGGYIFTGGREPGFAYLLLIDDYGNTIRKITYGSEGDYQFYDAYATDNEIIAVLVDRMADDWAGNFYVMRYSQDGTIISQIETPVEYRTIEPIFDSSDNETLTGFLLAGDTKLAKIDTNGNTIFARSYHGTFVDAFPLSDGSYLALGWFSGSIPSSDGIESVSTSLRDGDSMIVRFSPETLLYTVDIKTIDPRSDSVISTDENAIAENGTVGEPATPADYTGYEFVGWYEKDQNGEFLSEPFDFSSPITRDVTIYTKYEKKQYEIPFYMVVYNDSDATEIYDVIEVDRQTVYLNDTVYLPTVDLQAYNRVDNIYNGGVLYNSWYRGKVVNGENTYTVNNAFNDRIYQDFTYNTNYVSGSTQFDFLFIRTYRKKYTVHIDVSVNYDSSASAYVCGEYSDEMSLSSEEEVYHGERITTEIRSSSPDNRCVLSSLTSSPTRYGTYTDFDPESPIEGDLYIRGYYAKNSLVIRNDAFYYASGTPFDLAEASGISWVPESNTLTLNNYGGLGIEFENGEDPIDVVLIGENITQIKSSTTPIEVSGDGSLGYGEWSEYGDYFNSIEEAILSYGTSSVVINSGTILSDIKANDMVLNGGKIDSRIIICEYQYHHTDDDSYCGLVVNDGEVDGNIYAHYGNITINNISTDGSITADDGDIIIESGTFSGGDIDGERIVINGGYISGESMDIDADVLIINDGFIDIFSEGEIVAKNYFAMNGGTLRVINIGDDVPLGSGGYALFNGGTVETYGFLPVLFEGQGTVEEVIADEVTNLDSAAKCADSFNEINNKLVSLDLNTFTNEAACEAGLADVWGEIARAMLEEEFGSPLPTHGAIVEFNGGDISFNSIDPDDPGDVFDKIISIYTELQISEAMSQISTEEGIIETCGYASETDVMFATFKTWKIGMNPILNNDGTQARDENDNALVEYTTEDEEGNVIKHVGTLVPMTDENGDPVVMPEVDFMTGDLVLDEEGNPIMHALFNVFDEEGNLVNTKIGETKDDLGNTTYFKAGYSDFNDCVNNIANTYPDLARAVYKIQLRLALEQELAQKMSFPSPILISNESGNVGKSIVYISDNLFKDPQGLTPSIIDGSELVGKSLDAVIFGDGEGDVVFESEKLNEAPYYKYTTEHVPSHVRLYENAVISFKDYDESLISEKTDYHTGDSIEVPAMPTREATPNYRYTFAGWDKEVSPVALGDTVYTATYNAEPYDIDFTWLENQTFDIDVDEQSVLSIDVAKKFFAHKVEVDGEEITEDVDYVITEGSTVVTLQEDYLNSLELGDHTISVYFKADGEDEVVVTTTFTTKKNEVPPVPATDGDSSASEGENESKSPSTSETGAMRFEQSAAIGSGFVGLVVVSGLAFVISRKLRKSE